MRNILVVLIALLSIQLVSAKPPGHWLGILKIKPVTYRIYLKHDGTLCTAFYTKSKSERNSFRYLVLSKRLTIL